MKEFQNPSCPSSFLLQDSWGQHSTNYDNSWKIKEVFLLAGIMSEAPYYRVLIILAWIMWLRLKPESYSVYMCIDYFSFFGAWLFQIPIPGTFLVGQDPTAAPYLDMCSLVGIIPLIFLLPWCKFLFLYVTNILCTYYGSSWFKMRCSFQATVAFKKGLGDNA